MPRISRLLSLLLLLASLTAGGCAWFSELRMRPQIRRAEAAYEEGNYALAATLYESLGDRYPALPMKENLKLRHGIALYTLSDYHDARNAFMAYLKAFPQGQYKADAEMYLKKIDALLSPQSPALKQAVEAAKKDLNRLQTLRLQHPHDAAVAYAIGNLYYEMGNYEEAVRYYYEALTIDAAYKEKALQRMMIDPSGQPRPVTPEDLRRLEREARPLVVFDTHQYIARETDAGLGNLNRFYNVTGLVRNQSSRLLGFVEVEVSFFNAQHQLLDVAVMPIGAMAPGEIRPFRVAADSYDNLYNITSFEAIARVGR